MYTNLDRVFAFCPHWYGEHWNALENSPVHECENAVFLLQCGLWKLLFEGWCIFMTLNHKSSLKSLGYICSNSQQYIVWVKIIDLVNAKTH